MARQNEKERNKMRKTKRHTEKERGKVTKGETKREKTGQKR